MKTRTGLALAIVMALSSCAHPPQPSVQTFDPLPPSAAGEIIQSQPGDTVYAIAQRYNVSMRDVIALNNLRPPYNLAPGTPLTLPAKDVMVAPTVIGSPLARAAAPVEAPLPAPLENVGEQTYRQDVPIKLGKIDNDVLPMPEPMNSAPDDKRMSASQSGHERVIYAPVQQDELNRLVTQEASKPAPTATMPLAPSAAAAKASQRAERSAAGLSHDDVTRQLNLKPLQFDAEKKELKAPRLNSLPNSGRAAASGKARFIWPVQGRVVSEFGPKDNGLRNDGVNIAAARGAPVVAAEGGTVAYAGNDIPGYGNVVLIRHADGYMTTYAHLERIYTQRDSVVGKGETIGTVGISGGLTSPQLHFEVRKGTEAMNPEKFLPFSG